MFPFLSCLCIPFLMYLGLFLDDIVVGLFNNINFVQDDPLTGQTKAEVVATSFFDIRSAHNALVNF